MGTELRVGVAGATGALGGEILKVLDGARWRPATVAAFASATTSTTHVDYGEERVPVDDLDADAVDGLDALFVAVPEKVGRTITDAATHAGVTTIDCSGAFLDDAGVPLVVPWINPEALAEVPRGLVAVPDPTATLLASALGPLRRAGFEGRSEAVVMVPASREGKPGIEELSRQVVALFNTNTPPRKVFKDGLAFDLLPSLGTVAEDGWTDRERSVPAQVARLAGARVEATLVGVPLFSGISAHLSIRFERAVPPDLVQRVLADGGVQVPEAGGARYLPRPRRVEGRPFAHVGRVRAGADGRTVHLWLSMDNLRTTATAAVAAAAAILRVGRTDEA
jgi:aspartate-semialdehyde dehydrogenase